ncbi:MAG: hypothetical protein ACE5ES_04465 [Candidatus Nanoarchaeia archaeon]
MEEQENQNNKDELVDVEVWEFSLDEEEIDELIGKLQELKQTKKSVEFGVDENNELLIHYEEPKEGKE